MAFGGNRPTEPPEAIHAEFVLALPPSTSRALSGFGGVTGRWARSMPLDEWHIAQLPSSGCAECALLDCVRPAALSLSLIPVPVAKLMPSWQPPQARALGLVFQLSP